MGRPAFPLDAAGPLRGGDGGPLRFSAGMSGVLRNCDRFVISFVTISGLFVPKKAGSRRARNADDVQIVLIYQEKRTSGGEPEGLFPLFRFY